MCSALTFWLCNLHFAREQGIPAQRKSQSEAWGDIRSTFPLLFTQTVTVSPALRSPSTSVSNVSATITGFPGCTLRRLNSVRCGRCQLLLPLPSPYNNTIKDGQGKHLSSPVSVCYHLSPTAGRPLCLVQWAWLWCLLLGSYAVNCRFPQETTFPSQFPTVSTAFGFLDHSLPVWSPHVLYGWKHPSLSLTWAWSQMTSAPS